MKSILLVFHCESNTGYAIGPLEVTFFEMALELCEGDWRRIHVSYTSMERGPSTSLPSYFDQYLILDTRSTDRNSWSAVENYLRSNNIDVIFGFDQPVHRPIYKAFRRGGVACFISYWGAPMSSLNNPIVLAAKKLEVAIRSSGPDHYIFESYGMAETATRGRGISKANTSVVPLGVDTNRFQPNPSDGTYIHDALSLDRQSRVFFYAGHMEPRKGVAVIMMAANVLASTRPSDRWNICLFGNRNHEEMPFLEMLTSEARQRVLFAGYRDDLDRMQRGCYAGIIASTGWDSFPRTALEMQSSGLPLLASGLPGLRETVGDGESGFVFRPGDHMDLCARMTQLLSEPTLRDRLSLGARTRVLQRYSLKVQHESLVAAARRTIKRTLEA